MTDSRRYSRMTAALGQQIAPGDVGVIGNQSSAVPPRPDHHGDDQNEHASRVQHRVPTQRNGKASRKKRPVEQQQQHRQHHRRLFAERGQHPANQRQQRPHEARRPMGPHQAGEGAQEKQTHQQFGALRNVDHRLAVQRMDGPRRRDQPRPKSLPRDRAQRVGDPRFPTQPPAECRKAAAR